MRKRSKNKYISVHAIAGTEVVLLGMSATKKAAEGLLGFTIYKRKGNGKRYPLGGDKIFRKVHHEIERGKIKSDKAPFQNFMWSDYVVHPNTTYTYTVIPRYGEPGKLEPERRKIEITLTTENPEDKAHSVYFNRGVAGSQAYSRRWGKYRKWYLIEEPRGKETADEDEEPGGLGKKDETPRARPLIKPEYVPKREAYEWLSRGLEEAILGFIAQAKGNEYALRAAVYEFNYLPVIQAFVDALERGVDVKIVYHAKRESLFRLKQNYDALTTVRYSEGAQKPDTYKNKEVIKEKFKDDVCRATESAIGQIGLTDPDDELLKVFNNMMIERRNTQISHNKFIVLLKNGKPIQVWTGSTNFTAGGIFGQSNVGHVVRDAKVAQKYFEYWKKLSIDPKKKSAKSDPPDKGIQNWTVLKQPDLKRPPPPNSITPVFSPRLTTAMLDWYAKQMAAAKNSIFFTAAFSVDKRFLAKLKNKKRLDSGQPYLRYVMLETRSGNMWKKYRTMVRCTQNRIAWGDTLRRRGDEDEHQQFIETLTGLNDHVEYLHTKYMLIDPLSDDPAVITGSANFSEASTTKNDENMLIIRGNTRVADIFLGEFMRLFNHFHWRNKANKMSKKDFEKRQYLSPDDSWTKPYYEEGTQEYAERLLFK